MPSVPAASTIPVSEYTVTLTIELTLLGLLSSTSVVRPVTVEPPTSQLSEVGTAQPVAAKPT